MIPLTSSRAEETLAAARAAHNPATQSLSQQTFLDQRAPDSWGVGPFVRRPELDFHPRGQWEDPAAIGWSSASIINPTLIARGGDLHLFYRASPAKESLSSRIGHAVRSADGGWRDDDTNPAVHPASDDELLGVEDPKVYGRDGSYFLFYNGVFPIDEGDRARYPSSGYPVEEVGCTVKLATSPDLRSWTRRGAIIDPAVSRLWAKGAVIPRDAEGNAVKVAGSYLMYLSEGCDGVPHVGRSDDLITWTFTPQPYLDLTPLDGHLHEVATAFVRGDDLILDVFYSRGAVWSAAQVRYRLDDPFRQIELTEGGTLAWGGLTRWQGRLTFAQGWDTPPGERALQFYSEREVDG